jgi:hypothetical protein
MNRRVLLAGLIPLVLSACNLSSVTPTIIPSRIPPTVTAGNTATPTVVPSVTPVQLTLRVTDALVNCRFGPAVLYGLVNELQEGQSARVLGRNDTSTWWYVRDPGNPNGFCWISASVADVSGDVDALPIVQPPAPMVTGMTLTVEPNRMVVDCTQFPQTFFFEAELKANGPVLVHWQWEASTGALSDVGTTIFDAAGTKLVNEFYQVGGPNDYWVKFHILNPNVITEQANFRVSCTP